MIIYFELIENIYLKHYEKMRVPSRNNSSITLLFNKKCKCNYSYYDLREKMFFGEGFLLTNQIKIILLTFIALTTMNL